MKEMFICLSHWGYIKISKKKYKKLKKHCAAVHETDCDILYPFNNK